VDVRPFPALPVAVSWRRRLIAALVLVGAALAVAPAVRATPPGPRLLAVTAEVVAPPDGPPYVCRPRPLIGEMRGPSPVLDRCLHVPVAGVTTPGRARLVGTFRNGTFYVLAQQPPGPGVLILPAQPFCCRSVRAQRVLDDTLLFARAERDRGNPASLPYLAGSGRPYVSVSFLAWTDEVEAFVEAQPPGLIHATAWLMPV